MRFLLSFLITVFLLCSLVLEAQTDVTIHRKEFKTTKAGFDEACKHVADGNAYYGKKGIWYNDAFNEYIQALIYNNSNAELNYKTGVSALFSDRKEKNRYKTTTYTLFITYKSNTFKHWELIIYNL